MRVSIPRLNCTGRRSAVKSEHKQGSGFQTHAPFTKVSSCRKGPLSPGGACLELLKRVSPVSATWIEPLGDPKCRPSGQRHCRASLQQALHFGSVSSHLTLRPRQVKQPIHEYSGPLTRNPPLRDRVIALLCRRGAPSADVLGLGPASDPESTIDNDIEGTCKQPGMDSQSDIADELIYVMITGREAAISSV